MTTAAAARLLRAVRDGDLGAVTACLAAGTKLHVRSRAPHVAAAQGAVAIVEALLQAWRAVVNARDASGWTPLHHAVRHGRAACCAFLITRGAKVGAVSVSGNTPMHVGCFMAAAGADDVIKCLTHLLEAGARPPARKKYDA